MKVTIKLKQGRCMTIKIMRVVIRTNVDFASGAVHILYNKKNAIFFNTPLP